MGLCGSSVPEEIIPDPVGPDAYYFKKKGMMSRNFDIYKGTNDDGGKWLKLTKEGGRVSDKASISIENYVKNEETGKFGVLASCRFDTIDSGMFKQRDSETLDSDDSDYSSDSDADDTEVQKTKWVAKCKHKIYADKDKTRHLFTLGVKAKGKATRTVTFHEYDKEDGSKGVNIKKHVKSKVKKFIYHLKRVAPGGGAEETKSGEGPAGEEIPIVLHGSFNKSAKKLRWESPMFDADMEGNNNKLSVRTKDGDWESASAALIAFVACVELSPEDFVDKSKGILKWPTVHGPHGSHA